MKKKLEDAGARLRSSKRASSSWSTRASPRPTRGFLREGEDERISGAQVRLLFVFRSDCGRRGMAGRREQRRAAVRQRLVAATTTPGQAQATRPRTSRQSETGASSMRGRGAPGAWRLAREPERLMANGGSLRNRIRLPRRSASAEELREARERAAGAVPARDAARRRTARVPAGGGRASADQRKNEGSAGGVHADLPDLEAVSGTRGSNSWATWLLAPALDVTGMPAARPHVLLARCAPRCA